MKKILLKSLVYINLLAIVLLWYTQSKSLLVGSSSEVIIAFGRITGLLGFYLILLQLILIGRIRFIERVFGHDKLSRYHHLIGVIWVFMIFLHPILLTIGYGDRPASYISQFLSFLTDWQGVLSALIGLTLFVIAILFSTLLLKKLKYEHWHFSHIVMYFAIYLTLGHQTKTADVSFGAPLYYWLTLTYGVFGFLLLYRFLRPLFLFWKHRFKILRLENETDGVTSVYITGKNLGQFKFEPGQFAIINFLNYHLYSAHPFSFSASPNGEYIRFSIRKSGDFTDHVPELKVGTSVIIDGPLGVFTEKSAKKSKFLFIAGGIGITPIMAMSESISKKNQNAVLLYANRQPDSIVFKNVLEKLKLKIFYFISESDGPYPGPNYEKGRISKEKIAELVPDFLDREIYVCGPPPMLNAIVKSLHELGATSDQIHFEKFELSSTTH